MLLKMKSRMHELSGGMWRLRSSWNIDVIVDNSQLNLSLAYVVVCQGWSLVQCTGYLEALISALTLRSKSKRQSY